MLSLMMSHAIVVPEMPAVGATNSQRPMAELCSSSWEYLIQDLGSLLKFWAMPFLCCAASHSPAGTQDARGTQLLPTEAPTPCWPMSMPRACYCGKSYYERVHE